jgi:arginyl-tRNA synthetase
MTAVTLCFGNMRLPACRCSVPRMQFPEAVEDMLEDLMPNRLTEYLYALSERFTSFYTDCKVLGSDEEVSRLLLAEATARVMRQCFTLLGITPLYRI